MLMNNYIVINGFKLGQEMRQVILDTGAPMSYVSSDILSLLEPTGEMYKDFSPEFGELSGEYYRGNLEIESDEIKIVNEIRVGKIPEILEMFGLFDGIIGAKDISNNCIIIDFKNRKIGIVPNV